MAKFLPSLCFFLAITIPLSLVSQATNDEWVTDAHATFYGDMRGNETMCKS